MPIAEGRVETERPSRYLVQLCKHFSNKGRHLGQRPHGHRGGNPQALRDMRAVAEQARVEWSESEGDIALPWGRVTLRAEPGELMVRIEAAGNEDMGRLQELLAVHVERFGRRDGLRVSWQSSDSGPGAAANDDFDGGAGRRRARLSAAAFAAVLLLVLALHLGFGAVLLENWQWTGWAVGGVLVVVLVKVVVLGGFAFWRGRVLRNR
jgi:hypothetical protein